jgi:CYTH domain-containing protein
MAKEIERRFLVKNDSWKHASGIKYANPHVVKPFDNNYNGLDIIQAYLHTKDSVVRARIVNGRDSYLTVKLPMGGIERLEFEYEIPLEDARTIISHPSTAIIVKRRFKFDFYNAKWEIDEFLGLNSGLVLAEIELKSTDQLFGKPLWIGKSITHVDWYSNHSLARNPYSKWKNTEKDLAP